MTTLPVEQAKAIVRLKYKDAEQGEATKKIYNLPNDSAWIFLGEDWQSVALHILVDPEFWTNDEWVCRAAYAAYWDKPFPRTSWHEFRQHPEVQSFEQQYRPKVEKPRPAWLDSPLAPTDEELRAYAKESAASHPMPLPVEVEKDGTARNIESLRFTLELLKEYYQKHAMGMKGVLQSQWARCVFSGREEALNILQAEIDRLQRLAATTDGGEG